MKSSSLVITATVLLIMAGLFHHPVAGHHDDPLRLHMQIAQLAVKARQVHGLLIAMLALLAASLSTIDRRLCGLWPGLHAGPIAHSAAMLAWSWSARGKARWLAGAGAVAALPAAVMLVIGLELTPHTLMMMFAAHAAWYLIAAWTPLDDYPRTAASI